MNELIKMLKNQTVNNLATAFIIGGASINFFNTFGHMLFGSVLSTGETWVWKTFFTELLVYLLIVVVAWWVNSQAK